MYMWYCNGLFPPPQKKLVAKDRKESVQCPCFVHFFPLTDAEDEAPSSLSTKPKVQSLHLIHMGKGHSFLATIPQWDTEKGIFLALHKG